MPIITTHDEPLAKHSTIGVGGAAATFATLSRPVDGRELADLVADRKHFIIGNASNVLFSSDGFDGVIINTLALNRIEVTKPDDFGTGGGSGARALVRMEAGVTSAGAIRACIAGDLGGLDCLAGIPGTIGGIVAMNAGSFFDSLGAAGIDGYVEYFDASWRPVKRPVSSIEHGYRCCELNGRLVYSIELALPYKPGAETKAVVDAAFEDRRAKQPQGVLTMGSTFKNPDGDYAGRLLEASGLKGFRVGGASFSNVHANFIVNEGAATSSDVLDVMVAGKRRVLNKFNIILTPEVVYVGAPDPRWDYLKNRAGGLAADE